MTAPRYTAEDLTKLADAHRIHRCDDEKALRQAAETERVLTEFRAWLEKNANGGTAYVVAEFDRRFGRTP